MVWNIILEGIVYVQDNIIKHYADENETMILSDLMISTGA